MTPPVRSATRAWATSLAILMVAPFALAQLSDAEELRLARAEIAALRKQLAEFQARGVTAPAIPPAVQPAVTTAAPPAVSTAPGVAPAALPAGEGITVLSPFQVNSDRDYGYLKTNSVTATRIGAEIQRTPLGISILSSDFIADTNMQNITDILRYTASASGDNNFPMQRPQNATPAPVGVFTIRGFQVNTMLRNGTQRYTSFNLDNTDRVEVVKGPAALFFGQGAPGGVINYILKDPQFARIPTSVTHTSGSDQKRKVVVDTNQELSKRAALRVIGSWENSAGERRWDYKKNNNVTGALKIVPFDSGKLSITFRAEWLDQKYAQTRNQDWIYPDGWFQAYANPTPSLIDVAGFGTDANAYRTRMLNPGAQVIWGNDMRLASNNFTLPTYTRIVRGAYYQDANNTRIHDEAFSFNARGALTHDTVNTTDATVEASPFRWLDVRYVMTKDNNRFDSIEGGITPYADGRRFNTLASASAGSYKKVTEHQFDLVIKKDLFRVKNKVLVGGLFRENLQQFFANAGGAAFPFYGNIPGASNPAANTTISGGGGTLLVPVGFQANVPVNQVIRDRFGRIKTVQQVFFEWDPGFEIAPDIRKLAAIDRSVLDGYYTQDQAGYINYQGQAFDDRLTIMGGVRREMHRDSGQSQVHNFPWFAPPPYAFADPAKYPPDVFGIDPTFAGDTDSLFSRIAGTSWMAGVSYELKKNINIYTSMSKIYNRNPASNAGGYSKLNVPFIVEGAKKFLGNQPFVYNGKTINSADDLNAAFHENGADVRLKPETGQNLELGVKTSLWDDKLVGTLSIFHMYRVNRVANDATKRMIEPLNGVNNYQYFGPAGSTNIPPGLGINLVGRTILPWRTVGQKDVIEGAEAEAIWTPVRNFQSMINSAWLWTAKTDKAPTVNKPGSAAYNASTPQARVGSDIYYGARLENVPEFRLNTFSKYTFTEGFGGLGRGLAVGLGTR